MAARAACSTAARIVEAGRAELSEICAKWHAGGDREPAAVLARVADSLVEEMPSSERERRPSRRGER